MSLDIGSMHQFAKQLLGKNKEYEIVITEFRKDDYYNDGPFFL